MKIPAILYGPRQEVTRRCRKALTRHKKGTPWWEAVEAEGMLDTQDQPGFLMPGELAGVVSALPECRCYVAWDIITWYYEQPPVNDRLLQSPAATEVFDAGLERPYALIGLMGMGTGSLPAWIRHKRREREEAFLRATVVFWDLLDAEGARYSTGSNHGERLWDRPIVVKTCLSVAGVPREVLSRPLPPGGLRALLQELGRRSDLTLAPVLHDVIATLDTLPSVPVPPRSHPPAPQPEDAVARRGEEPVFLSEAMIAAMARQDAAAVQRLIEQGEPVDAIDPEEATTPLEWAIRHGQTAVVRSLLDHGASVDERYEEGESPLMVAAFEGRRDIVELLLERGADPGYCSETGWDAVEFAKLGQHAGIAALLRDAQAQRGEQPSAADEADRDLE